MPLTLYLINFLTQQRNTTETTLQVLPEFNISELLKTCINSKYIIINSGRHFKLKLVQENKI